MASDKLMNHTQGETIITKLTAIADSLDDLAAVTPAKLGMGIATCDTAASTAAKTAALANFALVEGAPVSVQFTYANTATNATLNINNTGAKPIIYKDAAIGNDVISAGDTCTFIYTTNTYKITNIDTLTGPGSGTVRQVGAENGLITDQTDNADIQTTGNIGLNLKSTTAFSTEVGAHNTSTDNMYPVALDSEGHPVAAVPTMSASGNGHKGGLVPDPGSTAGTKKYLAEDGTWKAPDSTWPSTPTDNTMPSTALVDARFDTDEANIAYNLNNGVKNKIHNESTSITANNLVFTANNDGTVTVTGSISSSETRQAYGYVNSYTPSVGDYLWGCPSGGSSSKYELMFYVNDNNVAHDYGNGVDLSPYAGMTGGILIIIRPDQSNLNLLFQPMLSTKAVYDVSPAYVPYALSNSSLTAGLIDVVDSEAKNLIQNMGVSTTINDVTFTVNADGSVSTSGTSNAATTIFYINKYFTFESGIEYVVSGCPSGGSVNGYRFCNMGETYVNDYGNGETVIGDGSVRQMAIYIKDSGTNMNGLTFKPMICKKSDWDISRKYVPSAIKSNAELSMLGLHNMNNGVKNLFDISTPDSTRYINLETLSNGGARMSCTNATWTQYYKTIPTEVGKRYKIILYIDYIGSVVANQFTVYFMKYNSSGESYTVFGNLTSIGEYSDTITATASTLCVAIYLNNTSTQRTSAVDLRLMICEDDLCKATDYIWQPFALPNIKITPELIKLVDSGAKNIFQLPNLQSRSHGILFTSDPSTGKVTGSGQAEGGDTFMGLGEFILGDTFPREFVAFCNEVENPKICMTVIGQRTNGTYGSTIAVGTYKKCDFTSQDWYRVIIRVASYADTGTQLSNETIHPMICSGTAFDVSPKYVPYRPDYDTISKTYLTKCKTNVVTTGSLDDVDTNTIAYYSNTVGGFPASVSGYAICETTVFDSNVMVQKLYMIDGVYDAYIRMKQTGTWRAWKQITNA